RRSPPTPHNRSERPGVRRARPRPRANPPRKRAARSDPRRPKAPPEACSRGGAPPRRTGLDLARGLIDRAFRLSGGGPKLFGKSLDFARRRLERRRRGGHAPPRATSPRLV